MRVVRLKTDAMETPRCIEKSEVVFSWNVETEEAGWKQEAYRIFVTKREEGHLVWDSGKVCSDEMCQVTYAGEALEPDTVYDWEVFVWRGEEVAAGSSFFQTALFGAEEWHGKWIGETEDFTYHIFRKTFLCRGGIKGASLYVCGLGHYEMYLNGKRVGDAVLEPGWTDYDKSCLYSCYDVTDLLEEGENGCGLILGDGMYNVPGGRYVYFPRSYGKCKFLVQMNIAYEDGGRQEIVSDESWNMAKSALTFSCIYGGEDFDARLRKAGFSGKAYVEDDSWEPCQIVEAPKGRLTAQTIPALKVMESYEPVKVSEVGDGKYLYDFGTNFSGWISVEIGAERPLAGSEIRFTPGELVDAQGMADQRVTGKGYQWKYTMDGALRQKYHPRFTYTGFRYVLVEGAVPAEERTAGVPWIEGIKGEFLYPDRPAAGGFRCSNELFNRIHQIICQAILSNTKSIFTDCPHREKLGWMEQTHLIGPGILYNYDVRKLYEKIERDMAEAQDAKGLVPDVCPRYVTFHSHEGYNDSPEWGSACIINPWYLYRWYGDREILVNSYDNMKRYIQYLRSRTWHATLHHGLGDWLDIGPMTPFSQNTPVMVVATCIYYYDIQIMRQIAQILGKEEDEQAYRKLGEEVFLEYNRQAYDAQTGHYGSGSQAAQAMSLAVGLVEEDQKEKVLGELVKDLERRGYQTTAGDVGFPFVVAALMLSGRNDVLDRMLNITDRPGYGYQVKHGATTLTEEWDGPDPNGPHGSQNHFMLGAAEEWFYGGLAGIGGVRDGRPAEKIVIRPGIVESCEWVEAWTMHPCGKVEVKWRKRGEKVEIEVVIPANGRGILVMPFSGEEVEIGAGRHWFVVGRG
ncbi:MAG: family 78 glycoside hydrolase catalytic domain [Eubacteriales bacterium]|nr:family 78 glycoside hydrolase catalytic domain [Eubacteriales bacterium]